MICFPLLAVIPWRNTEGGGRFQKLVEVMLEWLSTIGLPSSAGKDSQFLL